MTFSSSSFMDESAIVTILVWLSIVKLTNVVKLLPLRYSVRNRRAVNLCMSVHGNWEKVLFHQFFLPLKGRKKLVSILPFYFLKLSHPQPCTQWFALNVYGDINSLITIVSRVIILPVIKLELCSLVSEPLHFYIKNCFMKENFLQKLCSRCFSFFFPVKQHIFMVIYTENLQKYILNAIFFCKNKSLHKFSHAKYILDLAFSCLLSHT